MRVRASSGFGLVELLMVVAIIGVLAAINVPALMRARASANEAAAQGSLRAINSAQRAFAATCAAGFYAPSLQALGVAPDARSEPFLGRDLATPAPVVKNGYEITLTGDRPDSPPGDDACSHANGGPAASELLEGYVAMAVAQGSTSGSRNFWTNTSGSLFEKPRADSFTSINIVGPPALDPRAAAVEASRPAVRGDSNAHPVR
ncbi:MAG: type II secretion system GspH family protein [Acidobacteria bacterium]|nr:type II secretion system GspH family protein [Acidobacteriota bacterium]